MAPQVEALKEKADHRAENVRNGWLNWRLAWSSLKKMIWPSLAYPLCICSMSKKQGNQIVAKLSQALLPELGVQKKFTRVWRHAPL